MSRGVRHPPVLILAGPTGAGKTAVALALARLWKAEVISADSRQVYQDLSVGTAKPLGAWVETPRGRRYEVEGIVHHWVDVLPPTEASTAGRFAREAGAVLAALAGRGGRAVVAGGTGLYLRALTRGLAELPQADPALRKEFARLAEEQGRAHLHALLSRADPSAARAIPPNNIQRVIRALEVHRLTGKPLSAWHRESVRPSPWTFRWFALRWPAALFEDHLRRRCEALAEGLLAETAALRARGIPDDAPAWESLGYREALAHLRGEFSREAFGEAFFRRTRAYVKRQMTWFRAEPALHWIDVHPPLSPEALAADILKTVGE